eukprot:1075769-Prymnesium_polylepis.2
MGLRRFVRACMRACVGAWVRASAARGAFAPCVLQHRRRDRRRPERERAEFEAVPLWRVCVHARRVSGVCVGGLVDAQDVCTGAGHGAGGLRIDTGKTSKPDLETKGDCLGG